MKLVTELLKEIQEEKGMCLADCIEDHKAYLVDKIYEFCQQHSKHYLNETIDAMLSGGEKGDNLVRVSHIKSFKTKL